MASRAPPVTSGEEDLRQAYAMHRSRRFEAAEEHYRKAIARNPRHVDALHLYGVLCAETGRLERGAQLMRRAINANAKAPAIHSNLAMTLNGLRRYPEALASCERAVALKPDFAEAYNNRALALHNLNRLEQAVASCDAAIALKPGFAEAHSNRGLSLQALSRPEEALASYDSAIVFKPHLAVAHFNRAGVLRDLGRLEDALASYDRAVSLSPDQAEAYKDRASVLRDLHRPDDALADCDRVIALTPDDPDAHHNRAVVLAVMRRLEAALESFDRATALKPDNAAAHNDRAVVLRDLNLPEVALDGFDRAIALKPDYAEALNNRGALFIALGRYAEALSSVDRSIAVRPGSAEAHFNRATALQGVNRAVEALASFDRALALRPAHAETALHRGMLLLRMGRFEEGWRAYEWRDVKADRERLNLKKDHLWLGAQELTDKTLFIHHEQGLGDTLQFLRYVYLLKPLAKTIVVSVQDPLVDLVRGLGLGVQVLGEGDQPESFDYFCPLLSLPLALGTTLDSVPPPLVYRGGDPQRRERFATQLRRRARPRVGLAWSGNPGHQNDAIRSIPFARLAPLLSAEVDWIALQKEIRPSDVAAFGAWGQVSFHGDDLNSFSDTAALIALMDLVITVDTSIAHLAGSMGKPVWIMLPLLSDWRWLLARRDSPWYPTARLFRQPIAGDWDSVIEAVRRELQRLS